MCHDIEDPTFDATACATNPRARMRAIHRPPRAPADRHPHCAWTVTIEPDAAPLPEPEMAVLVADTRAARLPLAPIVDAPTDAAARSSMARPAVAASSSSAVDVAGARGDGATDYSGPLVDDLDFTAFSTGTLVALAEEVALQGQLLSLSGLLSIAGRHGEDAARDIGWHQLTGWAGLTATRLHAALGLGDTLADAAELLRLHPALRPSSYVSLTVRLDAAADTLTVSLLPCAALDEPSGLTWAALLASASASGPDVGRTDTSTSDASGSDIGRTHASTSDASDSNIRSGRCRPGAALCRRRSALGDRAGRRRSPPRRADCDRARCRRNVCGHPRRRARGDAPRRAARPLQHRRGVHVRRRRHPRRAPPHPPPHRPLRPRRALTPPICELRGETDALASVSAATSRKHGCRRRRFPPALPPTLLSSRFAVTGTAESTVVGCVRDRGAAEADRGDVGAGGDRGRSVHARGVRRRVRHYDLANPYRDGTTRTATLTYTFSSGNPDFTGCLGDWSVSAGGPLLLESAKRPHPGGRSR